MNLLDYAVLFASVLGIALYGILRTRGRKNLHDYLRGKKKQSWLLIGLSVMATQASAITFLSIPGQAYADGLAFIQNYFAVPIALVIIAAFFLPIYRKLNVYTAYEYLAKRFDNKTRFLAAALFLLQRGLAAGITIYAPAIVLSTVFNWSLPLTIVASGLVVTAYTLVGGSDAVTHTQKYQLAIIFAAMIAAFVILLHKIPCSFTDALTLAGHFGKTKAVSFSLNPKERYTVWTGLFGGIFLMLAYFGTDQSQVQRYISGDNLRESRLGLMFNALLKIPMQFFILLLGIMLFVFYLFHPAPVLFNHNMVANHQAQLEMLEHAPNQGEVSLDTLHWNAGPPLAQFNEGQHVQIENMKTWLDSRSEKDFDKEINSLRSAKIGYMAELEARQRIEDYLQKADPSQKSNDNDYVFITFILENLPHGLIGLLVAAFFAAALSAKAAELSALTSSSTIDFYLPLRKRPALAAAPPHSVLSPQSSSLPPDTRDVRTSKLFTLFWGLFAIATALLAHLSENLIQASNILGSVFSGVTLGLFLIAFFLKHISATPTFFAAILAQLLVFALWLASFLGHLNLAYLWLNPIGALATITLAQLLQLLTPKPGPGFPLD